ncbi:Disease resistance protein (NBS-LRR class) family [Raphanus sativus]|nr:Disease resistance protein (NBS-LRR class) family [Raphanus sativus]
MHYYKFGKDIAQYALFPEDNSQVISIRGMGGLGKTTLARQVFNHETIKSHFPGLAWAILRQLRPEYKVLEMTEEELQEKLVRVLETQNALIVIDDIWREGDGDRIKHVFLPKKGWKVILTSRNAGVALHADPKCVTFKPDYLTCEDSWNLFKRIAFPMEDTTEYKIDEDMEVMGKKMMEHCGGLPLALKVLGGLLAGQYTLYEWKRVYENIGSHIVGGTTFSDRNISSVFHVLYLSFDELPIYLKHCFLYLAHFPEDYAINVEKLSYYWAVEGISRPRYYDGVNIRDVADGYIEELVKRNMVISERDVMTSRFETCQLHDTMREVCLYKAEEENFLQVVQGTSPANSYSPCKSRRLAVHWPDKTFNVEKEVTNASLRTLLFIMSEEWKATSLFLKNLKLMRVLDLSSVKFERGKLPSSIGKLIHLRYLSLYEAHVTHLPSSMRNLKQLLYLNLYVHTTEHGNGMDLQGMTRLRALSIYIRGKGCTIETLSSSLNKIPHLENLIIDNKFCAPTNDDNEEGLVLDCVHLRQLKLEIYMPRLPDAQHFPSHLTTISLIACRLKEDPMQILEKLVHFKEVYLGAQSFCGRIMVCSRGGFPQLHKLKLWRLDELEEWIVEEGSMPLLHILSIRACGNLKEFPDGLRFITSLEDLSVEYMGEEWKKRLYFPSHLTTICLVHCRLEEDPMPILEKLLQLKEVKLYQSFCGRRMVCSAGGFPQLQELELLGLDELEEWIVEEGSMPFLHCLIIRKCHKLKELPDGLRFITSLKDLTCYDKGEQWRKRLSEGGEDYYKVQHIPSVTF